MWAQHGWPSTSAAIASKDRRDAGIGFHSTADHDRRAVARALLTARDAGAGEQQAARAQRAVAPDGIGEARVAAIDDQVARLEQRRQRLDLHIGGLPRLHHQDQRARPPQRADQLLQRDAGRHREALGLVARDELLGPARRPVVDGDAVAMLGDVEREILAHHAEADQADVRLPGLCHALPRKAELMVPGVLRPPCGSQARLVGTPESAVVFAVWHRALRNA
jgi:hypothetical protein